MSDRLSGSIATAAVTVAVAVTAVFSTAQRPAAQAAQRTAASAPSSRVPRAADGKPNLVGIWQVLNTAAWDIQDHPSQLLPGVPYGPGLAVPGGQGVVEGGEIPYQPWAAAKQKENFANRMTADPENNCSLPGVPRAMYMPFPFQIGQSRTHMVIASEYTHTLRIIPTDGSKHPEGRLFFWMGDPRGRWEGDTLVIDSNQFTDQTWFDRAGNFHSDALHVVERVTPINADHLNYEVTLEDPKVFTRPWKMSMIFYRRLEKNLQLIEYECVEWMLDRDIAKNPRVSP